MAGEVEREDKDGTTAFHWKLKFSSMGDSECSWSESAEFRFGGRSWRLILYPHGDMWSEGYIVLILYVWGWEPAREVRYSLGIRTAKGGTEVSASGTKTFDRSCNHARVEVMERSDLLRRRNELLLEDTLTFTVTLELDGGSSETVLKDASVQATVERNVADVSLQATLERNFADVSLQATVERNVADVSLQATVQRNVADVSVQATVERNVADVSVQATVERNVADVPVQSAVEESEACGGKGEPSERTGHEKIVQNDGKLWPNGDHTDVLLKVRDVEFKVHRTILAARTPVLGALFHHDATEKSSGEFIIDDCEPEVFEQLLHFIYRGAPRKLTAESASALYVLADKYLVTEVKALCVRCMRDTLCLDTFCDALTLSLMHGEDELLKTATDFLSRNMIDVMKTVEWQRFLHEHTTSGNEIMIRATELTAARYEEEKGALLDQSVL